MNQGSYWRGMTLGDIYGTSTKRIKTVAKKRSAGRHVTWKRARDYICIRPGDAAISNEDAVNEAFSSGSLKESSFFIFQNTGKNVKRHQYIPLYEAVYRFGDGRLILAQKRHLSQAYGASKRIDHSRAWDHVETVLIDGQPMKIPYWVDRHAFAQIKN